MVNSAHVQKNGQIVIPQAILHACGIAPGDELVFVRTGDGRFECRILSEQRSLIELAHLYAVYDQTLDPDTFREEVEQEMADDALRRMGLPVSDEEESRA